MPVMTCPHCEDGIESLTRTGDKKYSCGKCNMVIKHDTVQPHLDEMVINDKRGGGDSSDNNSNSSNNNSGGSSTQDQKQAQQNQGQQKQPQQVNTPLSEREKIYQRGTDGLREIKKERLKNWLAQTEGVGAQTEQRIEMVFDRNNSVHSNPHVLYNLLDDEIGGSASYLNTMVQDIFAPEEEHAELLQSQGYTPWSMRNNQGGSMQQQPAQGGPMNATGATGFSPNQQNQMQQQQQPQQNRQQPQQNRQQPQQGQQQQQSDNGGSGSDGISREEAQMMMQQAVSQTESQQQQNQLLSGLSDATDQALQEMASNVGGLAGTMQQVVNEALVQYARDNPEWVVENLDILQNIIGATDDVGSNDSGSGTQQAQEDAKVDDALSNLGNGGNSGQNPSRNTQAQNNNQQNVQPQTQEPVANQNNQTQNSQHHQTHQNQTEVDPMSASPEPESTDEKNPDIDESLMGDSEFEPEFDTQNFGQEEPNNNKDDQVTADNNIVEPQTQQNKESENNNVEEETNTADDEQETGEQSGKQDEDGFDEIFGDMME